MKAYPHISVSAAQRVIYSGMLTVAPGLRRGIFDKLECLISCLSLSVAATAAHSETSRAWRHLCLASVHGSSPVPARGRRRRSHDQGVRRATEERGVPGPLQRGLQERGEEGPPGAGGSENGGEGPEWVRNKRTL